MLIRWCLLLWYGFWHDFFVGAASRIMFSPARVRLRRTAPATPVGHLDGDIQVCVNINESVLFCLNSVLGSGRAKAAVHNSGKARAGDRLGC